MCSRIKRLTSEDGGSVTLETSISLTIFFILFLALFGMVRVVMAQNRMTHVLVQSTKSLSYDPYIKQNLDGVTSIGNAFWANYGGLCNDFMETAVDNGFVTHGDWYETGSISETEVKKRFVAFLAGENNPDAADKALRTIGIKDGLSGVDFETQIDGKDLVVTIKYSIEYWMDFSDMTESDVTQTYRSRIWTSR